MTGQTNSEPAKKTMTLNLTPEEMAQLERLAAREGNHEVGAGHEMLPMPEPLNPSLNEALEALRPSETADQVADYIRDEVCCPRIYGCELGGSDECPAERVRALGAK